MYSYRGKRLAQVADGRSREISVRGALVPVHTGIYKVPDDSCLKDRMSGTLVFGVQTNNRATYRNLSARVIGRLCQSFSSAAVQHIKLPYALFGTLVTENVCTLDAFCLFKERSPDAKSFNTSRYTVMSQRKKKYRQQSSCLFVERKFSL